MRKSLVRFALAGLLAAPMAAAAQNDMADVKIEVKRLTENTAALYGAGGNIGVSVGEDGVFLIDDQYAPLTDRIRAAIDELSDKPVKFVINTHWHGDHTGGNENLGKAGAIIVAHDNVRERMSTDQFMKAFDRTVPASPEAALPMVTFNDTVTFHLNGDTIDVIHVASGHTDGDSIVHFRKADVLHMGDIFFNNGYPFIDLDSGGSVQGMITAVESGLEIAGPGTKIIPGHGEVTDRAGLQTYHDMLVDVTGKVRALMEEGRSLEEIRAAGVSSEYDERWGGAFINTERFVGFIYTSLEQAD